MTVPFAEPEGQQPNAQPPQFRDRGDRDRLEAQENAVTSAPVHGPALSRAGGVRPAGPRNARSTPRVRWHRLRRQARRLPDRPRQPHRHRVRDPDRRRHGQGSRPGQDQEQRGGRAEPRGLRPRIRQHGVLPLRRHLHRRRQGHPRVPRLPHRAAGRQVDVPRSGLSAGARRAPDQAAVRVVGAPDHLPHVRAREHQELHGGLPLRRPPDGHAARLGRCAVDVLPRVAQHRAMRTSARCRSSG